MLLSPSSFLIAKAASAAETKMSIFFVIIKVIFISGTFFAIFFSALLTELYKTEKIKKDRILLTVPS